MPEPKGPGWGWERGGWQLARNCWKQFLSCGLLAYLPRGPEQGICYTCSSVCLLGRWDLLSVLLSKAPQRRETHVFGTRYAGKTSRDLEVGREGEKKTKESPPSMELKPVVVFCLAWFLHCTELGGRSPLSPQSYKQCPTEMSGYHFKWSF